MFLVFTDLQSYSQLLKWLCGQCIQTEKTQDYQVTSLVMVTASLVMVTRSLSKLMDKYHSNGNKNKTLLKVFINLLENDQNELLSRKLAIVTIHFIIYKFHSEIFTKTSITQRNGKAALLINQHIHKAKYRFKSLKLPTLFEQISRTNISTKQ